MKDTFSSELEVLINKYSMENGSNTPDFILKEYVLRCLENYDLTLRQREQWFGRPIGYVDPENVIHIPPVIIREDRSEPEEKRGYPLRKNAKLP